MACGIYIYVGWLLALFGREYVISQSHVNKWLGSRGLESAAAERAYESAQITQAFHNQSYQIQHLNSSMGNDLLPFSIF